MTACAMGSTGTVVDMDMFEQVETIPRLTSPHLEYAQKLIPAFVKSGIKYARLTNLPQFECTFATTLDTLRQVATPYHVRVLKRDADIYLFNEKMGGA